MKSNYFSQLIEDHQNSKKLTIYDIKRLSEVNSPYFFSPKTLKFFGQTMKSFKVYKQLDGRYLIVAPMIDRSTGRNMGTTKRLFNPLTNTLDHE